MGKRVNKDVIMSIRMTKSDKEEITNKAKLNNLTISDYMVYASLKTKTIKAIYKEDEHEIN